MYTVKKFKRGDLIKKVGRVSVYAKTPFWAVMKDGEIVKSEFGHEERYNQKYVAEAQCDYLNSKA